jgi:hypothetical protein
MHMTQALFTNIVLFAGAAIVATLLFGKVAPYLWGRRKGEPVAAHLARAAREQAEKAAIQQSLNMTPQKALRVRGINMAVMLGFLCFVSYIAPRIGHEFMGNAVLYFAGYVLVGLVVCSIFKAVPAGLFAGLTWKSRIDVRLYYAWLWPLTVIKAIRRKN